jgi:hypothetical protein
MLETAAFVDGVIHLLWQKTCTSDNWKPRNLSLGITRHPSKLFEKMFELILRQMFIDSEASSLSFAIFRTYSTWASGSHFEIKKKYGASPTSETLLYVMVMIRVGKGRLM